MRPEGFLTLTGITDSKGRKISTQDAVDDGLVVPVSCSANGWMLDKTEIPLGHNLFLDQGRNIMSLLVGTGNTDYTVTKWGFGTGTTPPKTTDVSLQNPLQFGSNFDGGFYKTLVVDNPAPYMVRFQLTLSGNDGNGYLVTEFGLYSGNNTLVARKVSTGLAKASGQSRSYSWRIRY